MSMSAKVIKAVQATEVVPLPYPSIGDPGESSQEPNLFVVPPFDGSLAVREPLRQDTVVYSDSPDDVLANARNEAARIIAQAEESKAFIEQAAFEQAQLDARAAIETEVETRLAEMRDELVGTLEKLSNLSSDIIGHAETDLVELSLQIAKKIVRREVTIDREIALTLVRVSLSKLNQRTAAEVHLNPEDLAYVTTHLNSLDFRGTINLVGDTSVSHGGCLIHTETGDIDARIESQFDEVAFGLLS